MVVQVERKGPQVAHSAESDIIRVDGTLYPGPAILRACYSLADIATFDVVDETGTVAIRVAPAVGYSLETVAERLRTSLIDFALREDIEARTRGMRELIWQTAFGETLGRDPR